MFNAKGFTLLELMITVAIVGIMSAIAYPSYQSHISDSRRADAKAALLGFANAMERFYTENNEYEETSNDDGVPTIYAATSPVDGSTPYYNLRVAASSKSAYTLNAIPINEQASDRCGTLTLTQTGARGAIDSEGNAEPDCW